MQVFSNKIEYIFFILFFSIFLVLFNFPDALDIGRYYNYAETAAKNFPKFTLFFDFCVERNVDVVYHSILYFFYRNGIHPHIATLFFLSLFFIIALATIKKKYGELATLCNPVCIFALFTTPFIWLTSISRNTAAVAFFYLSIYFIYERKIFWAIVFTIVSVYTHISMPLYIVLLIIAFFLKQSKLACRISIPLLFTLYTIAIFGSFGNNFFSNAILFLNLGDTRYIYYLDQINESFFLNSHFSIFEKIPIIYTTLVSSILLCINKEKDWMYWYLYLLSIFLFFSEATNTMLTQRALIILPFFITWNFLSVQKNYINCKYISNIFLAIAIIGILLNLIGFLRFVKSFSFEAIL